MARLLLIDSGSITAECHLRPGVNRIGRAAGNDLQICDDSVSAYHCEVIEEHGEFTIRDLGSTNGTFFDGLQIQEAKLRPGQTVRLGDVQLVFEATERPKMEHPAAESIIPIPPPRTHRRVDAIAPEPIARDAPKTFFRALPGVFGYPLRKRGPILLVTGTIFFLLLDLATKAAGFAPIFGLAAVVFLTVFGGGFLFSFMQGIVTTSASGEDEMPGWPDVSDVWQDIVLPFFRFMTIGVVCLLPGILALGNSPWLGASLLLFGGFCLPMALLAVSMADSIAGLNPLIIFPSILKVPGAYAVVCLMLLLIVAVEALSQRVLDLSPVPLLPTIVGKFISLYVLIVEMRVLGLLYRFNEHRLRWL